MKQGLHLDQVEISRGGQRLLAIDAHIQPGQVLTLMGPSGIGKSTLVNAIAGFLSPHFTCKGKIWLDGVDITQLPPEQRHVGVLFQDPLLFPHFSVEQNLLFALPPGGTKAQRCQEVTAILESVGLKELNKRDVATLSGGQASRVALSRVIASKPRALLLDEPFAKLDMTLRDSVRELVYGRIRQARLPALLVTHDKADAEAAGGSLVVL